MKKHTPKGSFRGATLEKLRKIGLTVLGEWTMRPPVRTGGRSINLRSDTVTQPTAEMRNAMLWVAVGDDEYGEDPTVIRLQDLAAEITGKEAALFVPSGLMGNQIAIMTHTKRQGVIILNQNSHIETLERFAYATLSNVGSRPIYSKDNTVSGVDVRASINKASLYYPETTLLCLENALINGTVVPLNVMKSAFETAKEFNIPVHLDGARLFNAATHLGVDVKDITQYTDSVMFCLSKGLCAPIGSMLCGSKEFIEKARHNRKMLGGGMRQAGVLAICGIIGLEQMTGRLKDDHDNAKYMATSLEQIFGSYIEIEPAKVHINMVFFKITKAGFDHESFVEHLHEHGIIINGRNLDSNQYRFMTHNDVRKEDVDYVLDVITRYVSKRDAA